MYWCYKAQLTKNNRIEIQYTGVILFVLLVASMTILFLYNMSQPLRIRAPNFLRRKANLIHSLPSAAFRRTPLRFVRLHFASLSSLISFSFSGKAIKLTMHTAVFTQSLSLRSLLHSFVSHSLHLFTPFRSLASYSCHGDAFWSVVLQPFFL